MDGQELGSSEHDWRADFDIFSEWASELNDKDASFAKICIDGLVETMPLTLDISPEI